MTGDGPRLAAAAATWDAEAAGFDAEPDHGLADPATREAWRRLLRGALPEPPGRVADLGCGTGTLSLLLAEDGFAVDGVDVSTRMVERARTKTADQPAVSVQVGDAAAPTLPKSSYDVVLCRHVLWALPDPAAVVSRWVDLLAPGGRLVLVEGRWWTGGGLTADECRALVLGHRAEAAVTQLPDPVYWGGQTGDERYLLVSRR